MGVGNDMGVGNAKVFDNDKTLQLCVIPAKAGIHRGTKLGDLLFAVFTLSITGWVNAVEGFKQSCRD